VLNVSYAAPSKALADYVSAFYLFETDEPALDEIERADIAQLRFVIRGSGQIVFGPGDAHPIPDISLLGPRMKASRLHINGPAMSFGMGLLPAGWLVLAGLNASDCADRIFDASGLIAGNVLALREAIVSASSFADMIAAAERHLTNVVRIADTPPFRLIRAVDEWLESSIDPDVGMLVERTGLSPAKLQRQLKAIYGAGPKLLARKYRALRTAIRIASSENSWQDFVGDAYYDQSHCIREIKAFTGVTPQAIRNTPRLTKATLARRQLKGHIARLSAET